MIRGLRWMMLLYAVTRVVRHPLFWAVVLGALVVWFIGLGIAW